VARLSEACSIHAELAPNAIVTHDDKILGVCTKIERQIDVSIRTSVGGHELLIVVQAKALARPAVVNVVGEFLSVVKGIRSTKRVPVFQ
jgi:hypothetical protein